MRASKNKLASDLRIVVSGLRHAWGLSTALMLGGVLLLGFLLFERHDNQRILQLAFFAVFALATVSNLAGRSSASRLAGLMSPALCWLLGAFFLLGALSSVLAFSPRHAFYEVASLLMLLMVGLHIASDIAQDGARNTALLIRACGLGCALYVFNVVLVYVGALVIGIQPGTLWFTPGFSNIRYLSHAQTVTLPFLVLLGVLSRRGEKMRWMWLSVAAFWWTLLFFTAARGAVVGLAAGTAVALFLRGRHASAFCRVMLQSALAGAAIYVVFFALVPLALGLSPFGELFRVVQRSIADPASSRGGLWANALALIAAHPWLGAGPLHFAHYGAGAQAGAHPHNWILQIASEWGVPALLCLCGAIGLAMRRLVQTAALIPEGDADNHGVLVAWIAIGVAILVDGLFSGLIVMPVSQLLIALYIGCAAGWAVSMRPRGVPLPSPSGRHNVVVTVLLLGSILGLSYGVWPEIGRRIAHAELTEQEAALNHDVYWPRMWRGGYF